MKRKTVSLVLLVALPLSLFIFLFGVAQIAQAAPIVVTTTVDENDGCGAGTGCSLREAVATAVAGDTIMVPAGTYLLTSGEIGVSQGITITGAGASSTMISGGGSSRIFNMSAGVIRISGITLAYGAAGGVNGGAVRLNGATLWLSNAIVSTNTANYGGGVYVDTNAQLHINNTQFISNTASNNSQYGGGAVYVNAISSAVFAVDSRFIDNHALYRGGAIFIYQGSVTLTNTHVVNNVAERYGGGIYAWGQIVNGGIYKQTGGSIEGNQAKTTGNFGGGGIYNFRGSISLDSVLVKDNSALIDGGGIDSRQDLHVTNSTFVGNRAGRDGGAIYSNDGAATIEFSTFTGNLADSDLNGIGNGGGIWDNNPTGSTTVRYSLIAGNVDGSGGTSPDVFGTDFIGNSYNLIGDATGSTGFVFEPAGTDMNFTTAGVGSIAEVMDTTLRDNGGGTETIALMPGSPAIDAIASGCSLAIDQRGEARPVDYDLSGAAQCDIGAFERQADETFTAVINASTTQTFGATLTTISDNNGGGNVPGNVTVTRTNQPPGGGAPDTGEMPFYVTITPDTDSGLDVDLTLCYTDWEVAQGGSVVEGNLQLFRYTGAGGVWSPEGADVVDTVNNCVTKYNVTQLSSWTLGNPDPTAVSLQTIGGELRETAVSTFFALVASLLGGVTLLLVTRRRRSALASERALAPVALRKLPD